MAHGEIAPHKTRTPLTIEKDLKERLTELAKSDEKSFNSYVIDLLKRHVKDKGGI